MEDTSVAIVERISQTFSEPRTLPNGLQVTVFYDCARLTPSDLARLAADAVGNLPDHTFDMAVGLAYTGIFYAAAVAGGRPVGIYQTNQELYGPELKGRKVVLVDDVIYTGKRLAEAAAALTARGALVVGFACIVDRSESQKLLLTKPIWSVLKTELK
jgi:orotate phosphoribosyltransferase